MGTTKQVAEDSEDCFEIDINSDEKKDIMNAYIQYRRAKLGNDLN